MVYHSAEQWNNATNKNILLFGMSGFKKPIYQTYFEKKVIGFIIQ
jgi:hypothetical protein